MNDATFHKLLHIHAFSSPYKYAILNQLHVACWILIKPDNKSLMIYILF